MSYFLVLQVLTLLFWVFFYVLLWCLYVGFIVFLAFLFSCFVYSCFLLLSQLLVSLLLQLILRFLIYFFLVHVLILVSLDFFYLFFPLFFLGASPHIHFSEYVPISKILLHSPLPLHRLSFTFQSPFPRLAFCFLSFSLRSRVLRQTPELVIYFHTLTRVPFPPLRVLVTAGNRIL